jgi:hypothetical protein
MPRLSKLREKTEPFRVEILGEAITGRYRRYAMTGKRLDELTMEILADGNARKANAEAVAVMVAEWDLLGEDDKPIALEAEMLMTEVPPRVLSDFLVGLGSQQSPPEPSSSRSGGSFGAEDE